MRVLKEQIQWALMLVLLSAPLCAAAADEMGTLQVHAEVEGRMAGLVQVAGEVSSELQMSTACWKAAWALPGKPR